MMLIKCCHASGSQLIDGLYDTARVTAPGAVQLAITYVEQAVRMSQDELDDKCMLQDQPTMKNCPNLEISSVDASDSA